MIKTYVPFEIQVEIIKRLPIKSLIRFRSISKLWKSLIDSSKFNADYNVNQKRHMLIRYVQKHHRSKFAISTYVRSTYVSIMDDDTFSQHDTDINPVQDSTVFGYSHGLFFLYCFFSIDYSFGIWNPTIRKTVAIPGLEGLYAWTILGFGVCPRTLDPKIVEIPHSRTKKSRRDVRANCKPFDIEVFSLRSGNWTRPRGNLPRNSIKFKKRQVVIGGFIYWYALHLIDSSVKVAYNLIMSFDLTNEEFREIYLPNSLAHHPYNNLSISKLRESLVVLEYEYDDENQFCSIWIMEHGVPNSFTKLYTIKAPDPSIFKILGFGNSGAPIIEMQDFDEEASKLVVYDPHSENFSEIGINNGKKDSFTLHSYTETLLLIDQQNCNFDQYEDIDNDTLQSVEHRNDDF